MAEVQTAKTEKVTKKRTPFNTTINVDIQKEFREYCNEVGLPLNVVLEAFMRQFSNGEFVLKFGKNKSLGIEIEE